MILLDTHFWLWWIDNQDRLPPSYVPHLVRAASNESLFLSAISCWEVALLVSRGRLQLSQSLGEWVEQALEPSGVQAIDVSPQIGLEANLLPGIFHADPADRLIVATARVHNLTLATVDAKILAYPHVKLLRP